MFRFRLGFRLGLDFLTLTLTLTLTIRIMLRDLEYVSELLKILHNFLLSNSTQFRSVITAVLNLCCKVREREG
jgi:hypothetical protein